MNNTPETDAATHDVSDYGPPVPCSYGDWVTADYARKLERERDEARKERDQLKQLLAADSENVDAYLGVCIERDEAREELNRYKRQWEESRSENVEGEK